MIVLACIALALAALFAGVTFANLSVLRAPAAPVDASVLPKVAVLIPARDEADNIANALGAILAERALPMEAIVLDDGSVDGTAAIVAAIAARDDRVRIIAGAPLPTGANGKQNACAALARATKTPLMLFVDADVRMAPGAVAAMAAEMERGGLDLLSGIPRQVMRTLGERLVVALIPVLMLGYLPLKMARNSPKPEFGAACGQLIMVRRDGYLRAGGHDAFLDRSHDGLNLPRNIRRSGGRTDLADATGLATCRMYADWAGVWEGFTKNATEGMATPRALPVWTVLLFGGHVLPLLVALAAWATGAVTALAISLLACALLVAARSALAARAGQPWTCVLLHPVAICVALAIQFSALVNARRGRKVTWKGRAYDA